MRPLRKHALPLTLCSGCVLLYHKSSGPSLKILMAGVIPTMKCVWIHLHKDRMPHVNILSNADTLERNKPTLNGVKSGVMRRWVSKLKVCGTGGKNE